MEIWGISRRKERIHQNLLEIGDRNVWGRRESDRFPSETADFDRRLHRSRSTSISRLCRERESFKTLEGEDLRAENEGHVEEAGWTGGFGGGSEILYFT